MSERTIVIDEQETSDESVAAEEVENEEAAEESVEETEETSEESVKESTEESEEAESEEDDLDFNEWAEQYGGVPDGIKSEEDLIQSYQSMLSEMKRAQTDSARLAQVDAALTARGFNGADGLLKGELSPQAPQSQEPLRVEKSYFGQSPATELVKRMKEDGRLRDDPENPSTVASYTAMGQFIDNAMAPELKKFEDVYEKMAQTIIGMQSRVRDLLWKDVPAKMRQNVDRREIDALIDKGLFSDYTEAINFNSFNNMGALQNLTNKAEDRGAEKERKKLRRGSRAIRKSGKPQGTTTKWDYQKYQKADGDWDNAKLDRLPPKQVDKMLEDWLKEHK